MTIDPFSLHFPVQGYVWVAAYRSWLSRRQACADKKSFTFTFVDKRQSAVKRSCMFLECGAKPPGGRHIMLTWLATVHWVFIGCGTRWRFSFTRTTAKVWLGIQSMPQIFGSPLKRQQGQKKQMNNDLPDHSSWVRPKLRRNFLRVCSVTHKMTVAASAMHLSVTWLSNASILG